MKFVTSILNRRAFVALAAASMLAGALHTAPASAADVTIPIIVKDTTSFYWQIVLAGARKAGKDLGVNVPELGAQAETDVNGQISILENAVAGNPAAIVIAPTEVQGARQADRRSRQPRSRSSASTPAPTPRPSPRS